MSRRASKLKRKVEKKRKAAIRATRLMYRFRQIPLEERDELVQWWKEADDETVLRAMGKAKSDAADTLEATGSVSRRTLRKLRREGD